MQQESLTFISLLAGRPHPQTTRIHPFDREHWFAGAYRTVQRSIAAGSFTQSTKQTCANLIFESFSTFTSPSFDAQIQQLIEDVAAEYSVSIGQSQKLVNILLKYHSCLYYSQLDPQWNQSNQWISAIHAQQHVPIDSIVLFGICRAAPSACSKFVTANARFAYSKQARRFIWGYNAAIYVPDSDNGKGKSVPWSGISDYKTYFRLQTIVRELAANHKLSPLLYEMRILWEPA